MTCLDAVTQLIMAQVAIKTLALTNLATGLALVVAIVLPVRRRACRICRPDCGWGLVRR